MLSLMHRTPNGSCLERARTCLWHQTPRTGASFTHVYTFRRNLQLICQFARLCLHKCRGQPGFTLNERERFDVLLKDAGLVDVYLRLHQQHSEKCVALCEHPHRTSTPSLTVILLGEAAHLSTCPWLGVYASQRATGSK
jgi:hypothetical protein